MASVSRFKAAAERGGARFLNRLFTDAERKYCHPKKMAAEHYAARFAAKEAFCKAVSPLYQITNLKQIEVCKEPSGKPFIRLAAPLKKKIAFPLRTKIELSLAHEREMAIASVVIVLP